MKTDDDDDIYLRKVDYTFICLIKKMEILYQYVKGIDFLLKYEQMGKSGGSQILSPVKWQTHENTNVE